MPKNEEVRLLTIRCKIFFELLSQYISNQDEFVLIKTAESSKDSPDIIITDIYELTDNLSNKFSKSKIVLLDTGLKKENIISNLIKYELCGVISFNTDLELFKKAIKVIYNGQIWVNNNLIEGLICKESFNKIGKITDKENQIIELVCEGLSNKQICSKLYISEQTVKAHLHRIFQKFDIKNRYHLIKIYSQKNQ